jgi:radical SAM superfamily enzyme YgiQ (UPF0313 family)
MADIVLTADKSMMVSFPATLYAGFLSVLPMRSMPDFIYRRVVPLVTANEDGTTDFPILSLRGVEASCVNAGFERERVKIAHPDHLSKIIDNKTKIVGVSAIDPLGIGPETTFWSSILSGPPHNRIKFARLMQEINRLKEKYHFQVVMGGPGSWQLTKENIMDAYGIDHVVVGEGETVIPSLFEKISSNENLSGRIHSGRIPGIKEVPPILGPANSSVVEIARGCGRGCQFCAPTTSGMQRSFPVEKIVADVKTYLKWNVDTITLHSEDTLRYGSKNFLADSDVLLDLYEEIFSSGARNVFLTHANLTTFAYQPDLIKKLTKVLRDHGMPGYGSQVGLETGSVRLAEKYMGGKCLPLKAEEWPQVVKEGLKVAEENRWISCCTVLMGLPDEDDEDVKQTMQLIKDIDNRFAFYFPIFFVPIGTTALNNQRRFIYEHASQYHWRLILQCWEHNVKYVCRAFDLVSEGRYPMLRVGLRFGINALYNVIQIVCSRMIKRSSQS